MTSAPWSSTATGRSSAATAPCSTRPTWCATTRRMPSPATRLSPTTVRSPGESGTTPATTKKLWNQEKRKKEWTMNIIWVRGEIMMIEELNIKTFSQLSSKAILATKTASYLVNLSRREMWSRWPPKNNCDTSTKNLLLLLFLPLQCTIVDLPILSYQTIKKYLRN